MPDESVVCCLCSAKFDDIKSIVECSKCKKCFHGKCVGLNDLRGFHMKRAVWKCAVCNNVAVDTEFKGAKRMKAANGGIIEMEVNVVNNMLQKIEDLSRTVISMNSQITTITNQNAWILSEFIKLKSDLCVQKPAITSCHGTLSVIDNTVTEPVVKFGNGLLIDTRSSANTSSVSYARKASIAKKNDSGKNSDKSKPTKETNSEEFTPVKKKHVKKISKPLHIGSKISEVPSQTPANANSGNQLEGTERRHWIYVGRCKPNATADVVSNYVKVNWAIEDVKCINLVTTEDITSFKVGVPESCISDLLDGSKWPKGVAVREFVQFVKKRGTGNFQQLPKPIDTADQQLHIVQDKKATSDDANFHSDNTQEPQS